MKLLIKNLTLLTGSIENPLRPSVHLAIENDRIAFVIDSNIPDAEERCAKFAPDRTLSGKHRIAMPGLINGHTHVGMNLLRNYGSDLNLQDWLSTKVFPAEAKLTPDDIHWASLLEMAEMILCGTTGFIDMYFFPEQGAENVLQSGLRARICHGIADISFSSEGKSYKTTFSAYEEFCRAYDGRENRLKVQALVHSTYLPPYAALVEMGEYIATNNVPVHIHLHETMPELRENMADYGKKPITIAAERGFFTAHTVGAHCVHLDTEDRQTLASHGVYAVHCPTSNLKLASGTANLQAMIKAGVKVCIGTDGASSNNNLNMFEELHIASILQKGVWLDPLLQPAAQMVHLATQNGAAAMGMDDMLGELEAGAPADLILLNSDAPHLVPLNDPVAAVVYGAQGSDVDTVIVAGKVLMEGRELKTIDIEKVKHQVQTVTARILGT